MTRSGVRTSVAGGGGLPVGATCDGAVKGDSPVSVSFKSAVRSHLAWAGKYFLRNLLFRSVGRPDPSMQTMYWSNWRTSMIVPVLSHFVGCGPTWFWTRTVSQTFRGGRRFGVLCPPFFCFQMTDA